MAAFRVFFSLTWHDRELVNSYYIVRANSKDEARKEVKRRAIEAFAPHHKAKVSIRTSFKKFV